MTEREWQAQVVEAATLTRWRHYHAYDSRRSDPGWPDLVLVRDTELLFVELKTELGRVSPDQRAWLDALAAAGAEVHVWRPTDFTLVWERLSGQP